MLLGMAALLANQNNAEAAEASTVVSGVFWRGWLSLEGGAMVADLTLFSFFLTTSGQTSTTAASTDDVRNGVNVSTKSGAKMLADAEFLVSLGGPVSLSTGTVSSPGGLRTLVASSATN